MSNSMNLAKLLGRSSQVPTSNLPTNIQAFDVTEIPTGKLPSNIRALDVSAGEIALKGSSTLTQSFDSNQVVDITLTDSIASVSPLVSVFKEVPQAGFTSKGTWDVNSNGTNYEFLDEKPISYAAANLTPSATGDGTFTNSAGTSVTGQIVGKTGADVDNYKFRIPSYNLLSNWVSFMSMNETGTILMMAGGAQTAAMSMHRWNLSTAYDFTTASYVNASTGNSPGTYRTGGRWSQDGTKLIVGRGFGYGDQIISQTASAWSTTRTTANTKTLSQGSSEIKCIAVSPDGLYVWIANGGYPNDQLRCYSLSVAWDVSSTVTLIGTSPQNDKWSGILSMQGSADGKKLWTHSGSNLSANYDTIYEWTMTTAWDPSTISPSANNVYPTTVANSLNTGGSLPGGWVAMGTQGHFWINAAETRLVYATAEHISTIPIGSSQAFAAGDVGKVVTGNSGSAVITATSGTYKSQTAFADTSAISSWTLTSAKGKADGSGIQLSGYVNTYNLASASYTTISPRLSQSEGYQYMHFKLDGTKVWVGGQQQDTIYEYDLSTGFDLSTISYGRSFAFSTAHQPRGFFMKPDGTRAYISSSDYIFQLDLSTAWNISTASYSSVNLSLGRFSQGFYIKSDGTKLYDTGGSGDIKQFTLTTPWDLSNKTLDNTVTLAGSVYTTDIFFNPDGTKFYVPQFSPIRGVGVYSLSTAWDTSSTITFIVSYAASELGSYIPSSVAFNADGSRMYITNSENTNTSPGRRILEYSTGSVLHPYNIYSPAVTGSTGQINSSTWQDINSMTADETKNDGDIFYAVSTDNRTSWAVAKTTTGVRKIVKNNSGTWQYNNDQGNSVGPDVSAGTQSGTSYDWTNNGVNMGAPSNLQWKPDGTKFFIAHISATASYGYDMRSMTSWTVSTPFSLNSAHISKDSGYFDVSQSTPIANPGLWGFVRNAHISDNGLKIHLLSDGGNGSIFQYNLTSAWDVTAIDTSSGSRVAAGGASYFNYGADKQRAMTWGDSGNHLYVFNETEDKVYQASLSNPYDITSTWSGIKNVSIPGLGTATAGDISSFQLNAAGNKMLMIHRSGKVTEWDLSTAWDISTATTDAGNDITVSNTGTATTSANGYRQIAMWLNPNSDTLFYSVPTGNAGNVNGYDGKTGTMYKIENITRHEYRTNEVWANGTTNNELKTLQQALSSQVINRMNKAQLDGIADANHFAQDSSSTLDLMIAPFATSGASPTSDGVNINYDAEALIREAQPGVDYIAEFPTSKKIKIKSLVDTNLKIRAQ